MDGVTIGIIDASLATMGAVVAAQAFTRKQLRGYLRTGSGKSRRTPEASERRLRGLRPRARRTPRTARPEAEAASIARVPQELLPSGHGQNDRRAGAYDETVKHYNQTRAGGTSDNDWCGHILDYYRHAMEYRILDYLKAQGYDVKR